MKPSIPSKVVIVPRPPAQGGQTVPESPVAPAQAEEIQAEEIQAEPCQATPVAGPAPASQPETQNE
jgi:hypothetical protein